MLKKEKIPPFPAVGWLGNAFNTAFSIALWHYFRSSLYVYSSILELSQTKQHFQTREFVTYVLCDYASDLTTTILTQKKQLFFFSIMLPSVVSEVSDCFASGEQDDLYHNVLPANS